MHAAKTFGKEGLTNLRPFLIDQFVTFKFTDFSSPSS